MKIFIEIRHRFRQVVGPLLGLTAVVYFAYHTVQGDRGLLAWWQLNRDIKVAEATLSDLQQQKDVLERRDRLLRPDRLDPDMLEERARIMLDMGHDDEAVVLHPRPAP